MSEYIDLADRIMAATATAPNTSRASAIGDTLEWFDRNSGQVPGRTITESESKGLFAAARRGIDSWPPALEFTGITVVPDPEPTNAEKIIELMGKAPASFNRRDLAKWLDEAGVRAPGGDDDQ